MTDTTRTIDFSPGTSIAEAAAELAALASLDSCTMTGDFNGITLTAQPGTAASDIEAAFWAESKARQDAYLASPEYAARQAAATEAHRVQQAELAEALKLAPETMTVHTAPDGDTWQHHVDINNDPYSACCINYAALWGRLMEGQMKAGQTVEQCADKMSRLADTEGITGFMYGVAVSLLAKFWTHGEALRRWHNLGSQIGKEGEKANESGGVLNPAMLSIG